MALQSGQVDQTGDAEGANRSLEYGSRIRLRNDFISGLKCFRNEDREGALGFFSVPRMIRSTWMTSTRTAIPPAMVLRAFLWVTGMACRCAARPPRESALRPRPITTLPWPGTNRVSGKAPVRPCAGGMSIDAGHTGLDRQKQNFRLCEQGVLVPGLRRENLLIRILGRLFHGSRKPWQPRDRQGIQRNLFNIETVNYAIFL